MKIECSDTNKDMIHYEFLYSAEIVNSMKATYQFGYWFAENVDRWC